MLDRQENHSVPMPDGREAVRVERGAVTSKSPSVVVRGWRVTTDDGQVLYVKSLTKRGSQRQSTNGELPFSPPDDVVPNPLSSSRIGIQLFVRDLRESKRFYEQILGLPIRKETPTTVSFGSVLALKSLASDQMRSDPDRKLGFPMVIFIGVNDIHSVRNRISRMVKGHIEGVRITHGRQAFSCSDPDGYMIEFYERSGELSDPPI
jgi:catechol 2,3-dioxygenase-like lactoylglutathione lyase family enzyme